MKKLTQEQIETVNNRLIKQGFGFIDIRIEVLDHLLCLIEKDVDSSFDEALERVFLEKNDYLKKVKQTTLPRIIDQRVPLLDFFKNRLFWGIWIFSFLIYMSISYYNSNFLLEKLLMLPLQIPSVAFILYIGYFIFSKNKVTQTFGVFFTISFLTYFYLLVLSYVKTLDNIFIITFLSFGTSVSLMMYYWFFYYKIKNDKKYKALIYPI